MNLAHFDGITYVPSRDHARLTSQLARVQDALADGKWHTLAALAWMAGAPESSVSARLRDCRKSRFGAHKVERRHLSGGLWEYRLALEDGQ